MSNAVTHKYQTVIAIDPDVDRNGVATLDVASKSLDIKSLSFPETLDYLRTCADKDNVQIVIEAGWLNHSNWHLTIFDTKVKAAAKGVAVGRNHEVGRKLAEMCEYWHIPYRLIKPLKKMWKGKDGKITATELKSFTGYKGRSNQEGRDAALLAWVSSNLPIKITR